MNQITLPAADLKQALPGLSKVVSRKSTLPVLQSVRLTRNQDGCVSLSATDLDVFVSYHLEQSQPGEPLDVLLPFEQLKNTGKGSDVVVIPEAKLKAKLRYQVAGSSLEQSVATLSPAEFPPLPKVAEAGCKMPENFGECLRQAFESSSQDSSRYVLQGAYLDVKEPKCHTIVSTNGRCLFAANTFKFDLKQSVNLSRQKFLEWSGFLIGECEMAVKTDKSNSGWVKLTTPRWDCVVKQIDGNFPNWRQVVPKDTETWTKIELSEAAIKQMLNLSSKLPGDDTENRTIQLRVGIKAMHLEGRNKDDKEFTSAEIADVKITGKPITTALNREYLQTALRCGLNEIRIHTELEPLLFLRPGKRLVVMPVRLQGATTQTGTAKPASPPQPTTLPKPQAEAKPERKTMPRTAKNNPPSTTPPAESDSAFSKLITQVDQIKDSLKNAVHGLATVGDLIKLAKKERKTTDKEIEAVRAKLRKIQDVTI